MGKKIKPVIKVCPECHTQLIELGAGTPSCPMCGGGSGIGNKSVWYCPACQYVEINGKEAKADKDDDEETAEEYEPDPDGEVRCPGLGSS